MQRYLERQVAQDLLFNLSLLSCILLADNSAMNDSFFATQWFWLLSAWLLVQVPAQDLIHACFHVQPCFEFRDVEASILLHRLASHLGSTG